MGRAEFGAEFRSDIEQFLNLDIVRACVDEGVHERKPEDSIQYHAFCDPSGGSSDSMTLAIAHRERGEDGKVVLDLVREVVPPFSPKSVVSEFAAVLRSYRCSRVTGDRYGGQWVVEAFKDHGIEYRPADRAKSDLYLELPATINSGRLRLLDNARLIAQLVALERRTARGGRDSIDHPRNQHDDAANAAAGAIVAALEEDRFEQMVSLAGPVAIGPSGRLADPYARGLQLQAALDEQQRLDNASAKERT